jgi:hypothetical protein
MRTSKRILKKICLTGLILGLTSTGWGIDRVKKNQSQPGSKEKVSQGDTGKEKTPPETESQPPSQTDKLEREKEKEKEAKTVKESPEPEAKKIKREEGTIKRIIKEDYDYFIDKNKNGIDDRLETKEKPKPAPKEVKSKKKSKPE